MRKIQKGYFTVEAALILPFTLAVIVFLIYIMFYQYNRCLADQDLGIMAFRGSLEKVEDKEQLLLILQDNIKNLYQDKFIAFQADSIQINLKENMVCIEGGGSTQVPFPQLSMLTGQDNWRIHRQFVNHRMDPVLFVRTCRKLKEISKS